MPIRKDRNSVCVSLLKWNYFEVFLKRWTEEVESRVRLRWTKLHKWHEKPRLTNVCRIVRLQNQLFEPEQAIDAIFHCQHLVWLTKACYWNNRFRFINGKRIIVHPFHHCHAQPSQAHLSWFSYKWRRSFDVTGTYSPVAVSFLVFRRTFLAIKIWFQKTPVYESNLL